MAKYVAIFNDSIDDIEINGFALMTEKELKDYEELASSITWSFDYPMGDTAIAFENGDELLSRIDFYEVSNEEFNSIKRVFNCEMGVFVDIIFLENIVDEEDDYDDDDDDDDESYSDGDDNDYGDDY